MKRAYSLVVPTVLAASISVATCTPALGQPAPHENRDHAANSRAQTSQRWVVRDPRTGKWFQQEIRTTEQPVSRWEWKQAEQTVYTPQTVTEFRPHHETIYVPQTSYVMQYKAKGTWNPFLPPIASYEYVPQTTWIAQTRVTNRPTTVQKWVAKQEKVIVPALVQTTGKTEQLVQTEISVPSTLGNPPTSVTTTPKMPQLIASPQTRQPLFRIPLLANQPISRSVVPATNIPTSGGLVLPPPMLPGSSQRSYAAPLLTSTPTGQTAFRDSWQTGLPATVVR